MALEFINLTSYNVLALTGGGEKGVNARVQFLGEGTPQDLKRSNGESTQKVDMGNWTAALSFLRFFVCIEYDCPFLVLFYERSMSFACHCLRH